MSLFFKDSGDECFFDLLQFERYMEFEEGIIEGKLGELMVVWKYTGIDYESSSNDELNYVSTRLNDILRSLGSGWAMWTEAIRIETSVYPDAEDCHFSDPISRMIDDERRIAVKEQEAHYETVAFIVLMYTPPSKMSRKFADAMVDDDSDEEKLSLEEKSLRLFKKQVEIFQGGLSSIFETVRLTPYLAGDGCYYCPILQLFHYCATGINRTVRVPHPSIPFESLIAGQDFWPSLTPRVGDYFIGAVSIEGMHTFTEPAMLAVFDQLPLKYRWSTRFLFLYRHKAIATLDQLLQSANPRVDIDAENMVMDTDQALAEIRSGDVNEGYYTSAFILYAETVDALHDATDLFKNKLDSLGYGARIERVNAVETFLGSVPGNGYTNIARIPINTANLADLLPVASAWPGDQYNPCPFYEENSPPLIQGETPGSTPFRLNLHIGDVGHTFIAGPTGSGKSTLLALIAAQHLKYKNAQVFVFDKGNSMFPLCCGVGGSHFDIGHEDSNGEMPYQFMPLADIDKTSDILWANNWIENCLELQGVQVNAAKRTLISEAMQRLRSSPNRSMSEYVANLQDREMREALDFYTISGDAGKLLDGENDSAEWNTFNVMEVGGLMETGDRIVLPVLLYLFKKIERSLTGRPTLLILDECWLMLDHPVFRAMIREWLKTLRKANTAVVMATQSVEDAAKSGIMDVINTSCLTKILLPNSAIFDDQIGKFYRESLSMNENEIGLLAHAIPKQQYYYRSDKGKRIFELNLRPKTLAYVGRSSPEDIAKVRFLMEKYPDNWREHWLDHCAGNTTIADDDFADEVPVPMAVTA